MKYIQVLIENTTVTVFIQKFDHGITVIFEKINDNTVIQSLERPSLWLEALENFRFQPFADA